MYRALVLVYTLKCNLSCEICCFSCSPKRNEKMELQDALNYVAQAKKEGMRILGITGGEPFLYEDEILALSEYATEIGLMVTITTNCFWASTYEKTLEMINKLKKSGVNHMKISCDEFHNKNIPYENIKNVLKAAREADFRIVVGSTIIKDSYKLSDIIKKLGDSAHGFNLSGYDCYPVGKAKECFDENKFNYNPKIPEGCPEKGCITIMPDGKTYPCGSMCGMIKERLIGSIKEESLNHLIEKAESNKHNQFITYYGIKYYYDYIKENKLDIDIENKFVGACDACYKLFTKNDDPELNRVVEELQKIYR